MSASRMARPCNVGAITAVDTICYHACGIVAHVANAALCLTIIVCG